MRSVTCLSALTSLIRFAANDEGKFSAVAMGVEGCTKCIKYLLFVFNFIFWLAGGVILRVAQWLRHDPQTSNLLFPQFDVRHAPITVYTGVYIIILVGAVMMCVGFLGCYGAIQESECLLETFFACLLILFACEVAVGTWGFVNRHQVSKEMRLFYSAMYQYATTGTKEQQQKALPVLKAFHETLQCCGDSSSKFSFLNLSEVCLKHEQFTIEDCDQKIDALVSTKLYLVGIAAVVVAVIMMIEMILSMFLWWGI